MNRILIPATALAVFAAATALAAEVKTKDKTIQLKPPLAERVDRTTPGLHDSLTIAPAVDPSIAASSRGEAPEKTDPSVSSPFITE